MKTINELFEVYKPKSPDEQKFVDKHVTIKHKDRNGNDDDVFNATKIKPIKRKEERHGYDSGEDEKVYEDLEISDEELVFELDEEVEALEEGTVYYKHYTITSHPKVSGASEGGDIKHVFGHPKKMGKLDIEHDDTTDYGTTRRVTVKNSTTGETTHHHVYQSERSNSKGKPTLSIRTVGKASEQQDKHANVIAHYLSGKTKLKEDTDLAFFDELLEMNLDEDTFTDASLAQLRVMKHKQKMKEIESSSKTHPLMKVRKLSDAKKKLAELEAARDKLVAAHEKAQAKKKVAEEVEELDELSRGTLGSYAKKAMAKEEVEHPTKAKNYENNIKIIKNEHQKLLKKGYNYIGSTNSHDHMGINTNHYYVSPNNDHIHHMSYANYNLKDTDNIKKYDKLKHNKIENTGAHAHFKEHVVEDYSHILDEARGRSRKKFDKTILEEVEQIDELSKDTVKNYADRAFDQSNNILKMRHKDLPKSATKAAEQAKERRRKGIVAAGKRLGKDTMMDIASKSAKRVAEDVEDLDEGLMHDRYLRSHGKKARGTGAWAFTTKQYGSPKENEMHFTSGQKSLSDAHKEAAAKLGTKHLYVMEEVEELDELSFKKLVDYTAKSADSVSGAPVRKQDNRIKGQSLADKKIRKMDGYSSDAKVAATNEEVEELDELSKAATGRYIKKASNDIANSMHIAGYTKNRDEHDRVIRRYEKRDIGISRAIKKLTKEEVEQIDELSKNTLKSYADTAKKDRDYHQGAYQGIRPNFYKDGTIHKREAEKRQKGIDLASKKLTKEDIINRAIEKYMPEDYVAPSLDEQFIAKIDHLAEGHAVTLLALFDSLNEENKKTMLETVDTQEGVNSLLDFAIKNRGE